MQSQMPIRRLARFLLSLSRTVSLAVLVDTVFLSALRCSAGECALYPIALSSQSLSNVSVGATVADILNGTQPGNFGWLTWAGSPSESTLVKSLTPPGNSATYVNPDNSADHQINVGDWLKGKPGVSNGKPVRDALNALAALEIVVPVWD